MSKRSILGLSTAILALAAFLGFAVLEASAQVYSQTTASAGSSIYSQPIYRNLTIGTSGADVSALQSFLSARGYMAAAPGYFDYQTQAAVIRYQAAHGIPATGFFGPITRGAYNAEVAGGTYGGNGAIPPGYPTVTSCPPGYTPTIHLGLNACVSYSVVPGSNNNGNNNDNNDEDLNGGEARLRNIEVDDGNDLDNIEEGDTDNEVMDVSFDVEDGDIKLDRADFRFEFTGDNDNADNKPWNVFDHASLLADGDEIAEMDVDSKSDWDKDGSDAYNLRFDNLDDYIVRDGDSADLTLVLDVNDNVDGSDNGDAQWDISVADDGIRTVDGDGNREEIGDENDTVNLTIDNGNGNNNSNDEELVIDDSSDTRDAEDIDVNENSRSDWEDIFSFDIEARNNDIDINSIPVTLDFLDGGSYDDYIDDIKIEIDGDEFDDVDVDDNGDQAVVTFNTDGDATVDEDDTVTATVFVRFKEQNDNYDDGDQIRASIDSDNVDDIDAEGDDNLDSDQLSGSAQGETMTLVVD